MIIWEILVKGLTPIIWNRMKREIQLEYKMLKKNEIEDWEEKNWSRKAEYDQKGNLVFPPEWFKGCLENACRWTRIVPNFATSKKETYTRYVASFTYSTEGTADPKNLKPYGKYVGGQGKNSSTKVWKVRPMLEQWSCKIIIKDPYGRMTDSELQELVDYMGLMVRVGDDRKNNFGAFEGKVRRIHNGKKARKKTG